MNKHIAITTIAAALACSATFAGEQKKEEVVKSETKNGNATAHAVAKATSSTTTNINGKPVTIMEDLDDNGKKRIRMITYENGKPKVKDITPKEKEQAKKEDPFWKKKPANDAQKPAEAAK
jgi:hypothetical protein